MKFSIHLGIPEILALWTKLKKSNAEGTISKSDAQLYKKWGKTMKLLSENPFYPSLNTHEISDLTKRYGMKVWQSYLENKQAAPCVCIGCVDLTIKLLQWLDLSHIQKIKRMVLNSYIHKTYYPYTAVFLSYYEQYLSCLRDVQSLYVCAPYIYR